MSLALVPHSRNRPGAGCPFAPLTCAQPVVVVTCAISQRSWECATWWIDQLGGMQYWRAMMRPMMATMAALALVAALAGCDEKKSAPDTKATTTVAPTPTPSTAPAPTGSGAAAAPSGVTA